MTEQKPCMAILQGTFKEGGQHTAEFKEYSLRSNANGKASGGTLIGKYQIDANLGQGESPHVMFIVQYPSREAAEKAFTNEEYTAIIPLRDVAFKEVKILLSDSFLIE